MGYASVKVLPAVAGVSAKHGCHPLPNSQHRGGFAPCGLAGLAAHVLQTARHAGVFAKHGCHPQTNCPLGAAFGPPGEGLLGGSHPAPSF